MIRILDSGVGRAAKQQVTCLGVLFLHYIKSPRDSYYSSFCIFVTYLIILADFILIPPLFVSLIFIKYFIIRPFLNNIHSIYFSVYVDVSVRVFAVDNLKFLINLNTKAVVLFP